MIDNYKPFPQSLDSELREVAELLDKDESKSEKIYILRNILASAYTVGHKEGFRVGMAHQGLSVERKKE